MLRGMQSTTRPTFAKTHSVTAQAASAIEQARFINFDGRHAMPGDAVQGVSEADVPAGRLASVITGYSAQVECAAAVTAGQGVGPSSDGTGRAAPGGLFLARSAGGVGDLIEVVLAPVPALVSGACVSGQWRFALSMFRLRITGTGAVTMDSRDSLGNITLNSDGPFTASAATDQIEFPYAGDNAREIRLTFPATATVEVI